MKAIIILFLIVLITGCVTQTDKINNETLSTETINLHIYNETCYDCENQETVQEFKEVINYTIKDNETNEIFFPFVFDGISHEAIINASTIMNLTKINGEIIFINQENLITAIGNGSYTYTLPSLESGMYSIRILWLLGDKNATTVYQVVI